MRVHVSYKVKYCHKIFTYPAIKARCEEIFIEVSEKYGFLIEKIGFDEDHVHLVIDMGVCYSAADIAKLLKGTSGRKLLAEFPGLKKAFFWGSGLWDFRLCGVSVGEKSAESALHYVAKQGFSREVKRNPGQQSMLSY